MQVEETCLLPQTNMTLRDFDLTNIDVGQTTSNTHSIRVNPSVSYDQMIMF